MQLASTATPGVPVADFRGRRRQLPGPSDVTAARPPDPALNCCATRSSAPPGLGAAGRQGHRRQSRRRFSRWCTRRGQAPDDRWSAVTVERHPETDPATGAKNTRISFTTRPSGARRRLRYRCTPARSTITDQARRARLGRRSASPTPRSVTSDTTRTGQHPRHTSSARPNPQGTHDTSPASRAPGTATKRRPQPATPPSHRLPPAQTHRLSARSGASRAPTCRHVTTPIPRPPGSWLRRAHLRQRPRLALVRQMPGHVLRPGSTLGVCPGGPHADPATSGSSPFFLPHDIAGDGPTRTAGAGAANPGPALRRSRCVPGRGPTTPPAATTTSCLAP